MTCSAYGPLNYGQCECPIDTRGLMDFYLDGPDAPRYKFCREASIGTQQFPDRGANGSLGDIWGIENRQKSRRVASVCVAAGNYVLRTESTASNPFSDSFSGGAHGIETHTPNVDPFDQGWTQHEGDWEVASNSVKMVNLSAPEAEDRGVITTEYFSPDVVVTAGHLRITSTQVHAGVVARYSGFDSCIRLEFEVDADGDAFVRLVRSGTVVDSANVTSIYAHDGFDLVLFSLTCKAQELTATVYFYLTDTPDPVLVDEVDLEGTHPAYSSTTTPSRHGLFGFLSADKETEFGNPTGGVFGIDIVSTTWNALYNVSAQEVAADLPTFSGTQLLAPNVVLDTLNPPAWQATVHWFHFAEIFTDSTAHYDSRPAVPDMSGEGFTGATVRVIDAGTGGYTDNTYQSTDWVVVKAGTGIFPNYLVTFYVTTERYIGLNGAVAVRIAKETGNDSSAVGHGVGYATTVVEMDTSTGDVEVQFDLVLGTYDLGTAGENGETPVLTPATTLHSWSFTGNYGVSFLNQNTIEADVAFRVLTGEMGPFNRLPYGVTALKTSDDGSAVVVTYTVPPVTTPSGTFRKAVVDGTVYTLGALRHAAVVPGAVGLVDFDSGSGEWYLRLIPGYSNTHATRWASAHVCYASDRFFYVTGVANWYDYCTEIPSPLTSDSGNTLITSGNATGTIDMLISHDGAVRLPVVRYEEGSGTYPQRYRLAAFSVVGNAKDVTTDTIKDSSLPYSPPLDIDFSIT